MSDDLSLRIVERLATLEVVSDSHRKQIDYHHTLIKGTEEKLSTLVVEVRQIRNALYFLGAAVSANVPFVQDLTEKLKILLHL